MQLLDVYYLVITRGKDATRSDELNVALFDSNQRPVLLPTSYRASVGAFNPESRSTTGHRNFLFNLPFGNCFGGACLSSGAFPPRPNIFHNQWLLKLPDQTAAGTKSLEHAQQNGAFSYAPPAQCLCASAILFVHPFTNVLCSLSHIFLKTFIFLSC